MIIGLSGTIGNGKDTVFDIFKKFNNSIQNKKFAYKLKLMVSLITGCDVKNLEEEEFKNSFVSIDYLYKLTSSINDNVLFEKDIKKEQYTYRELLQIIGDGFRNLVCKDIWANSLFSDYTKDQKWVITDLRYENEFDAIKKLGGINIRVERKRNFIDWVSYFNLKINYDCSYNDKKIYKSEFINDIKKLSKHFEGIDSFLKIYTHQSETGLDNYYKQGKFDYVIINDGTIEELVEKIKQLKLV